MLKYCILFSPTKLKLLSHNLLTYTVLNGKLCEEIVEIVANEKQLGNTFFPKTFIDEI